MKRMIKSNVIMLLFAVLCFTSCTESIPTASFYAPTNAIVGDNISFANNSMDADHYVWDFGDGQTSSELNPCHAYFSKGTYYVKLTAYSPKEKKFNVCGMSINVIEATPEEPMPTALFNASTTNATVDDNICFTNKSMNAHHYEWDFGDGQTTQESNPCHAYSSKGVYYVQLTAYSPSGEKCHVTGMNINVAEATGDIMFWMNSPGYIIWVELDGMKKEISAYYPTYNPDCGDEGCATFNDLTVGDHDFFAESYNGYWSGTITVEKGICKKMLLLRKEALPFQEGNSPTVEKRMAERIE